MRNTLIILTIIAVAFVVVVAANKVSNTPTVELFSSNGNPEVSVANIYGSKTNMDSFAFGATGTTTVAYNLGTDIETWQLKITTVPSENFPSSAPVLYFTHLFTTDSNCASSTDPTINWSYQAPIIDQNGMDDAYAFGTVAAPVYSFTAKEAATSTVTLPMEDSEAIAKCVKTTFYNNSTTAAFSFQVDLIKKEN